MQTGLTGINQTRIDWLTKHAKELEEDIQSLSDNPEYDATGHLAEGFLLMYDMRVAQLCGLYRRIGELYVAQAGDES